MRGLRRLRGDTRAVATIEFVLTIPLLFIMIVGTVQLGVLFYANAGLANAVAEGARYATIYPKPSTTQITAQITSHEYGLTSSNITGPTITSGTNANGANYIDVSMSYRVPLNFILFTISPVTLTQTRRAFVFAS
jgi:Flp pilus assembly protein TadG